MLIKNKSLSLNGEIRICSMKKKTVWFFLRGNENAFRTITFTVERNGEEKKRSDIQSILDNKQMFIGAGKHTLWMHYYLMK
jgi:hypothetical protein